jgi:hypothetical protein
LSAVLKKALSKDAAPDIFDASRSLPLLQACWPAAVGPRLAERTEVVSLDGGTLVVRVPDTRYSRILFRLRREILARLREAVGQRAPRALGFLEGAKAPPAEAAPTPRVPPPAAAIPAELASAARAIEDEEIRALFVASASSYLAQRGTE